MNSILRMMAAAVIAMNVWGQSASPVLNPVHAGTSTITGKATVGAGPITIFNVSFPARTRIGVGVSMDKEGNFAVAVKPAPAAGEKIIAVDRSGRISAPLTVTAPPSPAGPAGR